MTSRTLRMPVSLKILVGLFVVAWSVAAMFPLFWITIMSVRLPVDGLSSNPLDVLLGPATRRISGGLSLLALAVWVAALVVLYKVPVRHGAGLAARLSGGGPPARGWLLFGLGYSAIAVATASLVVPALTNALNAVVGPLPLVGWLATPVVGLTTEHYRAVWVEHGFYRNFWNSMLITAGVVTISLTVGTLAGYALARTRGNLAFWLLILALVFRALPHSVLVTGYVPFFVNSADLLAPLWTNPATGWFFQLFSSRPPTLYGMPLATIMVLVSINQPFTIWMLRSFFMNIPSELDEAARVDGCSHLGAFVRVIMPVMWPGVITTGLFSFLLAYNDYLVTALLLDAQSQTMVPGITQFLNRDTRASDQIEAIAAAVSITAPLFLLVMVFQKQIVSGLTAGAVKG